MDKTLFTINVDFPDNLSGGFNYTTLVSCLDDRGLRALFDDGLIRGCTILKDDRRVTALPATDLTWARFTTQIRNNATELLQEAARGEL